MKYTIAIDNDSGLLLACVPDGGDISAAVKDEADRAGIDVSMTSVATYSGLNLTNEMPERDEDVVYSGTRQGWLSDEHGNHYIYATR